MMLYLPKKFEMEQRSNLNNEQTAIIFKALAHSSRLQILQHIAKSSNCVNMDLTDILPIGRTTVNQHLEVLKKSGLLKWHHEGNRTYYCLNVPKVKEYRAILDLFFNEIDNDRIIECK